MPEPLSNTAVAAGGTGLFALLAGAVKWMLHREVKRIDDALKDHGTKIEALRMDHVGKEELSRAVDRVESAILRFGDRLDGKLDAVHRRIDQLQGIPPRE